MERESREISWSAVFVVASAVAVTALWGYLLATWPLAPPPAPVAAPARTTSTQPSTAPSAAPSPVADEEPLAVVLGDSFSVSSPTSQGPEWPELLGDGLKWQVNADAVDGSGYVSPGAGKPFPRRVQAVLRQAPDVVVLAGGYFDVRSSGVPQVPQAADRLVSRVVAKAPDTRVVVVSPFSADAPGPLTLQLSAALRQIAQKHDAVYVDATSWLASGTNLVAADGVHPTEQGQRLIARRMEQALKRLGVSSSDSASAG